MKLCINDECREVGTPANFLELLDYLKLPAQAVIIEHNGAALRRDEWPGRALCENDRLEIIRIVAGG